MIDLAITVARPALTIEASLDVAGKGITAVIGRSGAGKSTLLLALAGLVRPRAGHIRLDGRTLFDAAAAIDVPPERRGFGVVFQDGRLFPHLSVRANLRYGSRLSTRGPGPRFDDVVAAARDRRLARAASAHDVGWRAPAGRDRAGAAVASDRAC